MNALERWRERCSDAALARTGITKRSQREGIIAALSLSLYSIEPAEVDANLVMAIRARQDVAPDRKQKAKLPGLRLALTWLREEMTR